MLIPADGGTEDGTRADYQPIFNAITEMTGLHFELRVGQSYGAVIEGMSNRLADIAFLGPVSYVETRSRGAAELLAVAVENGESIYYAGIFVSADSDLTTFEDLKGKRVAFGDINSASSFTFQLSMMIENGLDPARDFSAVRLTGSHANAIAALGQGHVDAACLSFDSYERAVRSGSINPRTVRVLARSQPIPYPPLAMHPELPNHLKDALRKALDNVHTSPRIQPEMIRGYGGKRVDRYDANFPEEHFTSMANSLSMVTDELKGEILRKAAER